MNQWRVKVAPDFDHEFKNVIASLPYSPTFDLK